MEGINNKARVITKRAYGLKSASSLWTRLVLDLNLAAEAIGQTIEAIRAIAAAFRPIFSSRLHLKTEEPVFLYDRFRKWCRNGLWDRILRRLHSRKSAH